jgi:Leucine-rich repeat (LRR) protein
VTLSSGEMLLLQVWMIFLLNIFDIMISMETERESTNDDNYSNNNRNNNDINNNNNNNNNNKNYNNNNNYKRNTNKRYKITNYSNYYYNNDNYNVFDNYNDNIYNDKINDNFDTITNTEEEKYTLLNERINSHGSIEYDDNILIIQRQILYDLYESTDGNNWRWKGNDGHWNFTSSITHDDPCELNNMWQGINCTSLVNSNYRFISSIDLNSYNLYGTIPSSVCNLTYLQYFDLSSNKLIGSIPSSIGLLTHLTLLNLSFNSITGIIPLSLYDLSKLHILSLSDNYITGYINKKIINLQQLTYIHIGSNYIEGTIPIELCNLTNLQYLRLRNNSLTGTIPYNLGNLIKLYYLRLSFNKFTGIIPRSMKNLINLQFISISNNILTGTFPSFIGNFLQLYYLSIDNNQISGYIPTTLSLLLSISVLNLGNNLMSGLIPQYFYNFYNLSFLFIAKNMLTGSLYSSMFHDDVIQYVLLDHNLFTGSIPNSFNSLLYLQAIDVGYNMITGQIPHLCMSTNYLILISFANNLLTGSIPSSYATHRNLYVLILANNIFTGAISHAFNTTVQQHLTYVLLYDNQFTGILYENLFNSTNLLYFSAVKNCITSHIPTTICECNQLKVFSLDGLSSASNCRKLLLPSIISTSYISKTTSIHLYEYIPTCLYQLPELRILHLSGLGLVGSIPSNIPIGNKLVDLSLSYNLLTNTIPLSIQNRKWNNLDLSHNKLNGILSSTFSYQNINSSIKLSHNRISGFIPISLFNLLNISILSGNLYCSSSEIPQHDEYANSYLCESKLYLIGYLMWVSITVICLISFICIVSLIRRNSKNNFNDNNHIDINNNKDNNMNNNNSNNSTFDSTTHNDRINDHSSLQLYLKFYQQIIKNIQLWYRNYQKFIESDNKIYGLNIIKYINLTQTLINITITYSFIIIIILFPLYGILNKYYHTHRYTYIWVISLSYLSGYIPFIILYILLITIILYRMFCIIYAVHKSKLKDNITEDNDNNFKQRISSYIRSSTKRRRNIDTVRTTLADIIDRSTVIAIDSTPTAAITTTSTTSGQSIGNDSFMSDRISFATILNPINITPFKIFFILIYMFIILSLHTGANSAYVYITLTQSSTIVIICQMLLSTFKLIMNNIIEPKLVRYILYYLYKINNETNISLRSIFFIQLIVTLISNIFIPCFTIAFINPNCFYNLIKQENRVESYFYYPDCTAFDEAKCLSIQVISISDSYDPPFVYGYQCSSSILSSYASVYVYMCIATMFILPLSKYISLQIYKKINNDNNEQIISNNSSTNTNTWYQYFIDLMVSDLLKIPNDDMIKNINFFRPLFNVNQFLLVDFILFGLLVTFGTVLPTLGIILCFTIIVIINMRKIIILRFLTNLMENDRIDLLIILDQECLDLPLLSTLYKCSWLFIFISTLFYTIFFFDILGDDVGFYKTYWVLIVTPLIPIVFFIIMECYSYYRHHSATDLADSILQSQQNSREISHVQTDEHQYHRNNNNNNDDRKDNRPIFQENNNSRIKHENVHNIIYSNNNNNTTNNNKSHPNNSTSTSTISAAAAALEKMKKKITRRSFEVDTIMIDSMSHDLHIRDNIHDDGEGELSGHLEMQTIIMYQNPLHNSNNVTNEDNDDT